MTDISVATNGHRYELHSISELPDSVRRDFDYISGDDVYSPRIFKYRGEWYDVDDGFEPIPRPGTTPENLMSTHLQGWHGFQADSFYSGVVVRYLHGDDEGFVQVGTVIAS